MKIPALLCAVVFLGSCLFAQTGISRSLTLQEAETTALRDNPRLKSLADEVRVKQADAVSAAKRLNPVFSFDGDGIRGLHSSEMTFRLDQEFELGGKRRLRTEVAQLEVEIEDLVLQNERFRLLLAVRQAYLRAALAARQLSISRELLSDFDSVIRVNLTRLREGEISGGEHLRVEIERARFVSDLMTAELALANEKAGLLALMGQPELDRDIEIADGLPANAAALAVVTPQLTAVEFRKAAMERRREVQMARRRIDRFDSETRLQRALRTPNITAGGGYKRDDRDSKVVVGISIPLQISNRNEGGIARALAERSRAENEFLEVQAEVALQLQHALNAVDINRRRVEVLETQFVGKARQARDISLEAYRLGGLGLTDFLDTQRTYRETLRTYNQALLDARLSVYQLALAAGMEGPL